MNNGVEFELKNTIAAFALFVAIAKGAI